MLYTENGQVSVRLDGNSVSIEDSGRGMPQQQIESMFKPYQRGENPGASGFGIGLAIVKRLSDRFNWPINVASELGAGTTVRLEFPDAKVETSL